MLRFWTKIKFVKNILLFILKIRNFFVNIKINKGVVGTMCGDVNIMDFPGIILNDETYLRVRMGIVFFSICNSLI